MKYFHEIKVNDAEINLQDALVRHSADECICYNIVGDEKLYLGYYYPMNYKKSNKYPTFLFVHGGGWVSKKIFADQPHWQGDHLGYLARYYADKGFLCVSIDYRMIRGNGQVEEYELINSYEDCCDALDFILHHADEYGVDVNKLYLLGESAGGYLAGALATFSYKRRYFFKKVFLINAITGFDEKWSEFLPTKSAHYKLMHLKFCEYEKFLSPIHQIDGNTSEIILIHGEADTCVSLKHSIDFYNKMRIKQKKCELHVIEKTEHAFLLAEYTREIEACKIGIEIINKAIGGRKWILQN